MINWSKYFDRIYCLHYVEYRQRKQLLQFELKRVGILDSGIFEYGFTYPHQEKFTTYMKDVLVKDHIPEAQYSYVHIGLGHYNIIRDAYFRGYKNVLILEDDIRFLRDLNKIQQILEHKPENANIVLYDKYLQNYNSAKQFNPINKYYSNFYSCWSAGCYQLDRKGMERLINLMENEFRTPDNYFFVVTRYFNDLICCCSNTNIGVQSQFYYSQTRHYQQHKLATHPVFKGYKYINLDWDQYMIRDNGNPYYYGDYVIGEKQKNNQLILTSENDPQIIQTDLPIQPIQMNVCLAVTVNYIDKLLPIIYSLLKYSQSKFNVYIINDSNDMQKYQEMFKPFISQRMNIKLISSKIIDDHLNKNYEKRLTNLTFAKLVVPTLFPDLDRMLFLDYDTIILNRGLQWFYNIDFREHYLAACEDRIIYNQLEGYDGWWIGEQEGRIFKDSLLYFNAGVLMMNLKKIRKTGLDKKMIKALQHFDAPILIVDQSLLNYLCKNVVLNVNPLFNSFCPQITHCFENILWRKQIKKKFNIDSKQQFFRNVIVAHFACWFKPWAYDTTQLKDDIKLITFERYNTLVKETLEKINEYYMD